MTPIQHKTAPEKTKIILKIAMTALITYPTHSKGQGQGHLLPELQIWGDGLEGEI